MSTHNDRVEPLLLLFNERARADLIKQLSEWRRR